MGAFNTTNIGDIKGEFEDVVAPCISVYSATIEEGLGSAFLSSIIGLNMIKLFQAAATSADTIYDINFIGSADQVPAPNIPNCNYDFDFKKERKRELKGFECDIGYGIEYAIGVPLITTHDSILKFFEKQKQREEGYDIGFKCGTTVPVITTKREREGKYKFGTQAPATTTARMNDTGDNFIFNFSIEKQDTFVPLSTTVIGFVNLCLFAKCYWFN